MLVGPGLLLLRKRTKVALPTPIRARAANPAIQDASTVEVDRVPKASDEILELLVLFVREDFVPHFERHGNDLALVARKPCFYNLDDMLAPFQARLDLSRCFLAVELSEEFLDVLDLETT